LDAKRKKELKEMLLEMKQKKLEEIQQNHADKESINSFQSDAGDFADSASNIYEKELHMDLSEKNKQMLIEIEDALSKIENGSYGKCENCGEDISVERLKALPFAKRCIKCERGTAK
jgi:DnaK suppressor protein